MTVNSSYPTIQLIHPRFDSPLTDLIIDLNHLRRKKLVGSTIPMIFFQLKNIFHFLESLESARIEGNRTTLAELIDKKIEGSTTGGESLAEIANVEKAMEFIENNILGNSLNRAFLSEIHKTVVKDLSPEKEGDSTPGEYRKAPIHIAKSKHNPPDYTQVGPLQVGPLMEQLLTFINEPSEPKYDLLKTALAHHRFVWIHPFRNGNGRTVRLLTYAMLVKQGFNVNVGRILNPTAIFCNDRQKYYDQLAQADSGEIHGLESWCEYVLSGLKTEIEKIDNLLNHEYLSSKILLPSLAFSLDRKIITPTEEKILRVAIEKQIFQASDLKHIFPNKVSAEVSRQLRLLKEKKMIAPVSDGSRKYHIHFFNNYLLRGVVENLKVNGFVPIKDESVG